MMVAPTHYDYGRRKKINNDISSCMFSDKKDMMILGILSSCMRNGPKTECSKWRVQHDRQKPQSTYCLLSRIVCKDTFLFLLRYVNSL